MSETTFHLDTDDSCTYKSFMRMKHQHFYCAEEIGRAYWISRQDMSLVATAMPYQLEQTAGMLSLKLWIEALR